MGHREENEPGFWLVDLAPSVRQNRAAMAVAAIVLIGFSTAAPFATRPMTRLNSFFPTLDAIVLVTSLITAALLYVQFSITRSRALLALATGYLFTALIVIPHALTFAGAFSANGLLNAGAQTGSYLFIFWHVGFALAVLAYAILRKSNEPVSAVSPSLALILGTTGVAALVLGLTWLSTTGQGLLPQIITEQTRISRIVIYPIAFAILVSAVANSVLAFGRRSVLDQWIMVVTLAAILELIFSGIIPSVRFSVGFYVGRVLSVVTSSVVLIVVLAETTWLYAQLATANAMLRRERENKLMNFEAMVASIAHEVRGPLGSIALSGETTVHMLEESPPDLAEATLVVKDMVSESHRASSIFDNLRALFGTADGARELIDVNQLIADVLKASQAERDRHGVESILKLSADTPAVLGHRGQLQELVANLVQNAIEAMTAVDERRVLVVQTGLEAGGILLISVQDTGPGVNPEKANTIFDAFVTTKSHGRGLGLAICKVIVERHDGQLSVSPMQPRGAAFRIELPAWG
jgi:signal transduction histidine kinase